jgi:hypothetical protein
MTKANLNLWAILLTGLFWSSFVYGQESVNSSGGKAIGSGGTVAYSVGQVFYTTNVGNSTSIAQGVQNAYEIYSVGIEENNFNISLIAFPNPTIDNLTLQIGNYTEENFSYRLYDIQGRLLDSRQIMEKQTFINMSNLPISTYIMNVVDQESKKIKSFKISKN